MNSHLPPSRDQLLVKYFLMFVSVVAVVVVVYIAIQAVIAPWSRAPAEAHAEAVSSVYADDNRTRTEALPPPPSPIVTEDHLKTTIAEDNRQLDVDLEHLKAQIAEDNRRRDAELKQQRALETAAAKAQLQSLHDKGQEVFRVLDEAEGEATRWERAVAELLTNDEGRSVAASREQTEAFDNLTKEERPSKDSIVAIRRRIEAILQPVDELLQAEECTIQPKGEIRAELDGAKKEATSILHVYREHGNGLLALLSRAKATSGTAEGTLRQALDELHQAHYTERDAIVSRAVQEQRRQDAEKMAEIERARVQQEEELKRAQAEREMLVNFAKHPATLQAFAPFLTKGRTHPRPWGFGGANVPQWDFRHINGPSQTITYTDIQKNRMLTSFDDFLRAATDGKNDRPAWAPPVTDQQWAECRRRFDLFQRLAPVWLELKILDP